MHSLRNCYKNLKSKYLVKKDYSLSHQVNFQKHKDLPIHRWLKYREGYSVKLVQNTINELGIKGAVFDPFLGSGTTTYASALLGLKSYGIEINPFPAFVSEVKTRKYENYFINNFEKLLPKILRNNQPVKKPELRIIDKAFNKNVLKSLLVIKANIDKIKKPKEKKLAFFIWLSIIEEVSNTFKEGNGIKYKGKFGHKRPPRKDSSSYKEYQKKLKKCQDNDGWESKDVNKTYQRRFYQVLEDLHSVDYSSLVEPEVIIGNAKNLKKHLIDSSQDFPGISLTIFSPPYANCFDYYEIFKLELWLGGFINSYDDFKKHRRESMVSNLNANLNDIFYENGSLNILLDNINIKKLWDKRIIDMLKGYFRDMSTTLNELWQVTNNMGYVVIVVANSSYGDVIIPTDLLLAEIGENIGFKVIKIVEARSTNSSSQQMKRYKALNLDTSLLRESVVYLQKL